MRLPAFRLKLGTKVALIYGILGFLSLAAANLIWLFPSLTEIKQNAAAIQLEIAKRGAKEIETFVAYKLDLLQRLTYFLDSKNSPSSQKAALENFLQKDQAFFEMTLIDELGREKVKISQYDVFTSADLVNQSFADYFEKAIQGQTFISEVFFSEKGEPFVIVAIPVYSYEKESIGVLTAKLNLKETWQVVSGLKIGATSHAFLVDEKGRLIADPNPSLVLKNLVLMNFGPVKTIVQERQIATGLESEDRYLDDNNQWVLAAGVPLETLSWGLIIERQESEAYAGLNGKITAFVLITILGLFGTVIVARWLAGYLSSPLRRLGEGAKIIGSGNLDFRLNMATGDEIEELARSFNEMADQLKESYVYLEKKVDERTREIRAQRDQIDQAAKRLIQKDIALNQVRDEQEKALKDAKEARARAEEARLATLNILEDIEEAKRAQEIEKNKVEAVLRSLTDGLIMLDQFGHILLINGEAEKLLSIGKEEIFFKRLGEINDPEFKMIGALLEESYGQLEKKEVTLENPVHRVLEVSTVLVVDSDKKALGQLVIMHDVTREKEMERMKSEFVTIAAHQLRTPLSAVKWTLRLILDRDLGPISDEQEEILKKGYQSNERMINLVNDLLNVARIEEGRYIYGFKLIQFGDFIAETLDAFGPLLKMKNIALKFEKPKESVEVLVDKEKMRLVVQNLIENAINYSPAGSTVTISLKSDKMNLTLAVEDRGMGIPKAQQGRVFGKFFRGDNAVKMETEGTGLGLFLTKNIVERHGGKIWFETEENRGSTFYFTLPLKK